MNQELELLKTIAQGNPIARYAYADLLIEQGKPDEAQLVLKAQHDESWIMKWDEINDNDKLIVFPLGQNTSGSPYLSYPIHICRGWELKRRMQGVYTALRLPEFNLTVAEWKAMSSKVP